MKITVNKHTSRVNEIKTDSPQYQETANITGKEKVLLDDFFEGKNRIFKRLERQIVVEIKPEDKKEVVEEFGKNIVDNSIKKILKYKDINKIAENPYDKTTQKEQYDNEQKNIDKENERRRELISKPYAKALNQIVNGSYNDDEGIKFSVGEYIRNYIHLYKLIGLHIDYQRKLIITGDNTRYPLLKFFEKQKKVMEVLEETLLKYSKIYLNTNSDEAYISFITSAPAMAVGIFDKIIEKPKEYTEFLDLLQSLRKNKNVKIDSYQLGRLLFGFHLYGITDIFPTLQFETFLQVMERMGYEAISKKSASLFMMISRVPLDIVRMSDFENMQSCHSVNGAFASCATQEGRSLAGSIAYLFRGTDIDEKDIKKFETSDEEIMVDPDRNIKGLQPLSRLRIRTFEITLEYSDTGSFSDKKTEKFYVMIPSNNFYGSEIEQFKEELYKYVREKQKDKLSRITEIRNKDMFRFKSARYMGGGYFEPNGMQFHILADYLGIGPEQDVRSEYPERYESPTNVPAYQAALEFLLPYRISELKQKYNREDSISSNISSDAAIINIRENTYSGGYRSGRSNPDEGNENKKLQVLLSISLRHFTEVFRRRLSNSLNIDYDSITEYFWSSGTDLEEVYHNSNKALEELKNKGFKHTSNNNIKKIYTIDFDNKKMSELINNDTPRTELPKIIGDEFDEKLKSTIEDFLKNTEILSDIEDYNKKNPHARKVILDFIEDSKKSKDNERQINEIVSIFKRFMGK
jgi:hypothetical protein